MAKKIMVVDDNPDLLYSIEIGLKDAEPDYEIIKADSGKKCLEILKDDNIPDLILLDIMMPEMSGWEIFDLLKNNTSWNKIPVIFLSARSDDFAKNAGRLLAKDYIEKPFEINDLVKRIKKQLSVGH